MIIKTKKIYRKAKKYIKNNWEKIVYVLLKRVGIIAAIVVLLYISIWLKVSSDIPITISVSTILITITIDSLNFFYNLTYFMDNRRLSKPYKGAKNITLYRWAEGVEVEERFFYSILKDMSEEDAVKNLISIKKTIKKACSGNLSTLRLLRAYIERSISNNILDKFWSIFIGVLVGVVTTIITKLTSTMSFIQLVNDYINKSNGTLKTSNVTFMINYATYFFIFMLFIMFVQRIFTRDKHRLKLISQVIDIAIMEIETKKNRDSS